jgi:uncharacterized protein YdeI (YjbR/CyaY-like superfamily)
LTSARVVAIRPELARIAPATLADWRAWLEANSAATVSVWLVVHKKSSPDFAFPLDQAVEEALCFGWIDSLPRKLDDRRSMLLFSPRKTGSLWSALNKRRVEKVIREGRMAAAGLAKIEAAKADGTWSGLDAAEALEIPADLADAFRTRPGSRIAFEAFPRFAKRAILEWIIQAKTPPTRAKRVLETAEKAAIGERANRWRKPGG